MKAIAPDALGIKFGGNGIVVGECAMAAVESGIETGDLSQRRCLLEERADWRQIVGLVQRR